MPTKIKTNNVDQLQTVGEGYDMEIKKCSQHQTSKSGREKISSPRVRPSSKLRDESCSSRTEKPIARLYTHLFPPITHNIDDERSGPSKSSRNSQKQQYEKKATKAEELVKHMSNVPCYLQRPERGDNIQGKALNFGVLDWGRLEEWKYSQKQVSSGKSLFSQSSSSTSSPFSTVGSSAQSCRSHSGSLTQMKQSRPMNSHLNLAAKESHSQKLEANPYGSDLRIPRKNNPQGSVSKVENSRRKGSVSKVASWKMYQPPEVAILSSNSKHCEVSVCAKQKLNNRDGDSNFGAEPNQDLGFDNSEQYCSFDSARDYSQSQDSFSSELSQSFGSTQSHFQQRDPETCVRSESQASDRARPAEAIQESDFEKFRFEDIYFDPLSLDVPHSCPRPCEVQKRELSDMKSPLPTVSSDVRCSYLHPNEIPTIQSEGNHAKKNKSPIKPTKLSAVDPSDGLVLGKAKVETRAGKIPSANLPSYSNSNRVRKSASFKEGLPSAQQSSSTSTDAKFRSVKSGISASDNTPADQVNARSRSRQSPLRRMLDPLLKPVLNRQFSASTSSHTREFVQTPKPHLREESTSTDGHCKASDARLNSLTSQPAKRNLNLSSWVYTNSNGLRIEEKSPALTTHARLELSWKNGLPLYKFSSNNDHDILAAPKISVSGKDEFDWVYTFYSVCEIKKKNGGWLNQGSKSKKHAFISNVVGEMKVSCSESPKLSSCDYKDHRMVREFVLFDVTLKQPANETLKFLPSSELAAIIVDVPKEQGGIFNGNGSNGDDLLEIRLTKSSRQEGCSPLPPENQQAELNTESRSRSNIMAILPGGDHGLPTKDGVPSPLIERWRSGCDCGGWDVGCTLTVLTNQDQDRKILKTSRDCCTSYNDHHIHLFLQGEAEENKLVFSMAALMEDLYLFDYGTPISSLQACSICIAILHSRKPINLSEVRKLLELKTPQEPVSTQDQRVTNTPKKNGGDVPARILPYPPVSPVGRV